MKTKQLFSKTLFSALFAGTLLFGSSSVFAQVKIGTNPTTIGATNNLEVEASTAGNKVSVDKTTGKVTIADGSQGAAKVLTSDVNGVATWQTPNSLVILTAYNPATLQPTIGATTFVFPIPYVSGDATGYNPATGAYTIPISGFYNINYSVEVYGIVGELFTILGLGGLPITDGQVRGDGTWWNARTSSITSYFSAGTVVSATLLRGGGVTFDANWKVRKASFLVIRY